MKVQTYINEGPGMLWQYEPGDRLVEGPVVATTADHRTPHEDILDGTVWHVGNRMAADAEGNAWPSNVRSLSMGDVVVIGETAYTAVSVGWEPISTEALARSLGPESIENQRMAEHRLATR